MSVDIGTGLAVMGVSAPIVAAIFKFAPNKNGNGNGYIRKELCEERYTHLSTDITEIKRDVKKLLTETGK